MEAFSPYRASFRRGFYRTVQTEEVKTSRRSAEISPEGGNKVHVAVGKSYEKAVVLLQWACRNFGNSEICILHVHQLSPSVPTLVGRLSAFRNKEKEAMRQRLYDYLNVCWQFKVKTSIITTEAGEVHKGIMDLVNEHNVKKLVIGAIPDTMKAKKISRKASYIARNAPMLTEILFVYKGNLVYTRKNSQSPNPVGPQSPGPSSSTGIADTCVGQKDSPDYETWAEQSLNNEQLPEIEVKSQSDSRELVEFSFSDLQIATCDFSESFKIGESGYGVIYKGELLDRTVVIKKLHTHDLEFQTEFLNQVEVLGKLNHHNLVTLVGICPDAWSLVYEYIPGGSLHARLFHKTNIGRFPWKIRAKIVADIAKGLLFLHSTNPEKIVHGNLKPENILIDSDNSSKICDFGIYSLILPQTGLRCPSFGRVSEPKGVFTYTDPEFLETGNLTPKSDIYSFGLIILQILTGRTSERLSRIVRRAVGSRNLKLILDSSSGEWPAFVARRLADLGMDCCESNSRDRPELTPILVNELESLQHLEELEVPSLFLCPISQEIMYDPHVAADGFTYEGDAIREWLGSGHDTSPMTNLKLSHLELSPNSSLRLAIRDWLSKS